VGVSLPVGLPSYLVDSLVVVSVIAMCSARFHAGSSLRSSYFFPSSDQRCMT